METAKQFLFMLRTKFDLLITSDVAQYLEVLYDQSIQLKDINAYEYVSVAFKDDKQIEIVVAELNKAVKKARMLNKLNSLKKMVSQDVNRKRTAPAYLNEEDSQKQKETVKKSTIDVKSSTNLQEKKKVLPQTSKSPEQKEEQNVKKIDLNETITQTPKKAISEGDQESSRPIVRKQGIKKQLEAANKRKCRYFPFCTNGDNCHYFHPREKCAFFPHCRFADNCLYIHEICKYGNKCCRLNCSYAHQQKDQFCQMMNAMVHASKRSFTQESNQECLSEIDD